MKYFLSVIYELKHIPNVNIPETERTHDNVPVAHSEELLWLRFYNMGCGMNYQCKSFVNRSFAD